MPKTEVKLVEEQMFNKDGMWYGVHITVRGTKDTQEALDALVSEYGEERVYGSSDMLDQFRWGFAEED